MASGQPGEVGRKLGVLCYQQQGAAADFPVVQLVVLERGCRDAQLVGELRPAEAEAFTQLTQALAASIIERRDGHVALVGTLFHGLGPVVVIRRRPRLHQSHLRIPARKPAPCHLPAPHSGLNGLAGICRASRLRAVTALSWLLKSRPSRIWRERSQSILAVLEKEALATAL